LYGTATNGYGNTLNNVIVGNSNNNTLYGYGGNDTLYGYDGNDRLDGGTGNDTMAGGTGNDTYVIDSVGDVVIEAADAGIDNVDSFVNNYTLGANIETLHLYGTATTGTGNELDNEIDVIGDTSNNDTLYGQGGNDILLARNGNDTLYGGDGNDELHGRPGKDTLNGDAGNDSLYGDDGDDTLYGGDGTDSLHGGSGKDTLNGNTGNDSLYGDGEDDKLNGGTGDDILNGGTGNDTMVGGAGNDTYYVDSTSDVVTEAASAGIDSINAFIISYTLGANVEHLYLYSSATNGTGNALDNTIFGNSNDNTLYGLGGNDALFGGSGNDTLYGGAGQDRFFFSDSTPENSDIIVDFSHADDTIMLRDILDDVSDSSIQGLSFTGDVLNTGSYFEGADSTGNGTNDRSGIFNDTTTGNIYYNPTSYIGGDSALICTVGTPDLLDNTDFVFCA
ncbi:MAG: calcium-binding protein, partial [Syntrophaceae bacterium]